MQFSAVIVDDEENARINLQRMLARYCPQVAVQGMAGNAKDALELVLSQVPDIVFLDVEMPGGSGFDLLEHISPLELEVVFVTAFSKYAEQAFEVAALHYLTKPIDPLRLVEAVKRFERKQNRIETLQRIEVLLGNHKGKAISQICLPTLTGLDVVWLENIIRLEADGNYTKFYFADGPPNLVAQKLKFYEEQLSANLFFRPHNSYIVNRSHIVRYQHRGKGGTVKMSDGFEVDVSVRRKETFLSWLKKGDR